MARHQTRGTISVSRHMLTRYTDYAEQKGVAVSALTEFLIDQAMLTGFDTARFDTWFAVRERRISALKRTAAAAAVARRTPWANTKT